MKKNKFKIYTLGCKVNQYDSEKIFMLMKNNDFKFVKKNADIVIINTCSVTKSAIHKDKRMINKAKKENPRAKIIVSGCWPRIYEKECEDIKVDLILKMKDIKEIVKNIFVFLNFEEEKKLKSDIAFDFLEEKSRYFLKIQDGCEQFCSYCIIPYTRGKLESRADNEIIEEIELALKKGYKEIVLCGIHLGLYGIDRKKKKTKKRLVPLLKKIIKIKNLGRVRLSSVEMTEVDDELIKLISKSEKICKHLHIPLQSGSDKILKLMNRPYDKEYFRKKIKKIRSLIPEIAITTDVIIGFPGENEKDFLEVLNFVKEINFSRLHIFSFSAHEKTLAFNFSEKVSKEKIKERVKKLKKIGDILEKKYRNKFIGKKLNLVVENIGEKEIKGKSEFYFDVNIKKENLKIENKNLIGKIINVKYKNL